MKDITVTKQELISKLEANRAEHRAIFEEAIDGYRDKAIELLKEQIKRVRNGAIERVIVSIPIPEDHTNDYDRVLAMLNMEITNEIVLTEADFATYVLDDWGWQGGFIQTSSNYSALARSSGKGLN